MLVFIVIFEFVFLCCWMLHQSIIIGTEKRYNWLCICVYLCVGRMLVWYECMCAWIWVMFDACIVDEWRALTNTEKWILNRVFCDFHILLTRKKKTSCHPRLTVFITAVMMQINFSSAHWQSIYQISLWKQNHIPIDISYFRDFVTQYIRLD